MDWSASTGMEVASGKHAKFCGSQADFDIETVPVHYGFRLKDLTGDLAQLHNDQTVVRKSVAGLDQSRMKSDKARLRSEDSYST